ncbi:choice-of-anchor L domain-containing protein [Bacillus sp. JJ1533]|uniref:choice-of-anchor L domain-containing protein n=1 Tax=Bacillus sp. JJ1533 TaxID=3122959 RepID=UPI002FFE97D3
MSQRQQGMASGLGKKASKILLALSLGLLIPLQTSFAEDVTDRKGETKTFQSKSKIGIMSSGLQVQDMGSLTPEDLVRKIVGNDVSISNVKVSGVSWSSGIFTGGDGIIGFNDGIVLSSGSIQNAIGPNTSSSISESNGLGGDGDLNTLVSGTRDATYLEFDFVPRSDVIKFQYVFSSDEYNEYAGSSFNDVFGFFVNGQNVAILPGTSTPVSINNVNHYLNTQYFVDNTSGALNTEMDGLTTVLPIEAHVNKNQVNHIKLAIADVGDSAYDSNVFIKAGSFTDNPNEVFGEGSLVSNEGERRSFGFLVNEIDEEVWNVNLRYTGLSKTGALMINIDQKTAENVSFLNNGSGIEFDVVGSITKVTYPLKTVSSKLHVKIIDNGQTGDIFELTILDGPYEGYTTGEAQLATGQIGVTY